MKTLILFIIIFLTTLNAESILNIGPGLGTYGGVIAEPYSNPAFGFNGATIYCGYDIFFQPMQSISVITRYSGYDKSGLLSSNDVNSNIYYFGLSYNISNVLITDKYINEISPVIAYGIEKVEWGGDYTSYWDGSDQSTKGEDLVQFISLGLRGTLGVKKKDTILKISLSLYYDHIINSERSVISNTADWIEIENPKYKTDIYGQLEFTIGFML